MPKLACLYLVIPCYNEEEMLPISCEKLKKLYERLVDSGQISQESRILFVNDGSKDKTWQLIQEAHQKNAIFSGVNLTRNRGHQNALLAGLMLAKDYADVTISIDADLQDDLNAIDDMLKAYQAGANIVYGVRNNREADSFFKRVTAQAYYKVLSYLGGDIIYNHADFRLMDRKALEELSRYKEVNLFLRGLVPMIGLNTSCVYYERHKRLAGESKYPLKKMLALAFEGITSLSIRPIKLITYMGLMMSLVSLIALVYALVQYFRGEVVSGWTSIVASIWLLGGIQISAIGLIGEYIGKIYLESKHRPRYGIKEVLNHLSKGSYDDQQR
ncbi:glycosyltransferase [Atopobacter sp. AH10]|uniref:glycosyltransferase family 2 protein n=1 Tax=Atopobacter sp. AH10 TaxID=2315861 RepID=UPI000EF1F59E|nr:glycosyltransferase family 2 protein [Atopobacter sp. AH10]RLK63941.1 glycosyltransferase [Atopobacter sp. AH10]